LLVGILVLVLVLGLAPPARANAIADGGFESGAIAGPFTSPLPLSNGHWAREGLETHLVSPPAPVHVGNWSLEVDTRTATIGSAAYQDFDSGTLSYVWTFWIRPTVGRTVAEYIYNWDRSAGFAIAASVFLFRNGTTDFNAWGTMTTLAGISFGAWHEVKVVGNRCTQVQDVSFDGAAVGSVHGTIPPPQGAATVILGDVAFNALHGRYHFDDVSFDLWDCTAPTPKPCPFSQGYWKTHVAAWPVDTLTLGAVTYGKSDLRSLLSRPPRGDASLILAHQLVAAKLNIASGSDATPIADALSNADALLATFSGPLPHGVPPSSAAGRQMTVLAGNLTAYNEGAVTPDCIPRDAATPILPPAGVHRGRPPARPDGT